MGHLYSPYEIIKCQIPSDSDYELAIHDLKDGLQRLVDKHVLFGAVLVGSITSSDFEIGSDVDLFVVTESDSAEEYLRNLSLQITDLTHVYFDIKLVTRQSAQSGRHRLLYYYVHTIRKFSSKLIIGNDPTSIIADNSKWQDLYSELFVDTIYRLEVLVKGQLKTRFDFNSNHCAHLERILTTPIYAAIGLVRLKFDGQPSSNGKRFSKIETCKLYESIIPGKSASIVFKILGLRQEYRRMLKMTNINIDNYRKILHKIGMSYPDACYVLEECIDYLDKNR